MKFGNGYVNFGLWNLGIKLGFGEIDGMWVEFVGKKLMGLICDGVLGWIWGVMYDCWRLWLVGSVVVDEGLWVGEGRDEDVWVCEWFRKVEDEDRMKICGLGWFEWWRRRRKGWFSVPRGSWAA
jgi:hypothetical protein